MPPVFSRETTRVSVQDASHAGQGRTSPCECRCPAGNPIQKMERAIADGNEALALEYLRARNPFPGVTGRVCPHPCETGCNRNSYDEGVAIRALERHAADYGSAFRRMKSLPSTGKRIAVIGSGPAGLTCAYFSALLGHTVDVFEASPVAGGVPRQAIPDFRLPKAVVDREVGLVLGLGVNILTNTAVGRDISLASLLERYDACLIAAGNGKERRLNIPGIEHALPAVRFLRESNLNRTRLDGKRVAILGGGGVAFDCAFTVKRLGAAETHLVFLEDMGHVRVPAEEIRQAEDEGIRLHPSHLASAVHCGNGTVSGVTADAVSGFRFDERGNLSVDRIPGSVLELEEKKYLCFGGAESQDREDREPGVNWWKEEMPSDEEYAFCEENLAACDYKVDYVLTHDAPSRFLDFTALASGETNQLHSFLDKILLKLTYDKWFFGCYHKDTQLSTKSRCVFCDVISMGERHAKRSVR